MLYFSLESDRDLISGLYRQTFDGVIAGAVELTWTRNQWNFPLYTLVPLLLMATRTLEKLNLGGNQLTGAIPRELGKLTQLKELDLSDNKLTGAIPRELGRLTRLTELNLNGNYLERPPGTPECPYGKMEYYGAGKIAAFFGLL